MRFQAFGLAFHARMLVDAYMIRSQTLSAVFLIHGLGDVSDMRFWALGPAFHAHGLVYA